MKFATRFLTAKHWQLFILTFGIIFIFQISILISIFTRSEELNKDPSRILNILQLFPIMMIFYCAISFGWFWSVAIGLQNKIPLEIKMKIKKFKIFFFIPLTYMLFITLIMTTAFSGVFSNDFNPMILAGSMIFIIPLHLFSIFCMLYILYFTAKTLKTAELQRNVTFSEFIGEFFMIWFFPFGIWIIQPRINKIIEGK